MSARVRLVPSLVLASLASLVGCASAPPPAEPGPSAVRTASVAASPMNTPRFPASRVSDHVDTYHGVSIPDPYRWLEDPDSPESRAWIDAQNAVTQAWLAEVPERETFRARLTELWNYERYGAPFRRGTRYFFTRNDGLQNQAVLYWSEGLGGEPRVLLDPNTLSKEGVVALSSYDVSEDGKRLVYGLSEGGSDWVSFRVRDVETGQDLDDLIRWSKFSGAALTLDGAGFYYGRFPEPREGQALEEANYYMKLYFHRLGTPQSEDRLVVQDLEHKERGFSPAVTEDGRYLVIHVWQGTDHRNRIYVKELARSAKGGRSGDEGAAMVKLLDDFDAGYRFLGNHGSVFYFKTDLEAPRGRVIAIDLKRPARKQWKTIIPEGSDPIENVSMLGGGFVVERLVSAASRLSFHDRQGKLVREVELPGIGSVGGLSGHQDDPETFVVFTSFTSPGVVFRLDLAAGTFTPYRQPKLRFDPAEFVTEQRSFPSVDGTLIPMFIVARKGLPRDGQARTLLYGYGGFNVSMTPGFSPGLIALLERGFIYAEPSLRGGAEFGEAWHQAGMLGKKQNVFDDFASAARFLYAEKYTRPERLAIQGGSNGGLLVGASITQHPELFGAAIAQVGVLDMLRFHKFTIGHAWVSEYGSSDDPEQFAILRAYSPLHNLKLGTAYPPTLILTADHDDRVVPAHSFKFTAALQAAQGGRAPVMIRVETKAGHGAGKPTTKIIDEVTDRLSFLVRTLGP